MRKAFNYGVGTVVTIAALLQLNACALTPDGLSRPTIAANPTQKLKAQTGGRSQLGMNLSGVAYWTTAWAFVDAFKINGGWISQREGADWGKGGDLKLTPDGWVQSLEPGQYAEALMYFDSETHFPGGNYTILYDGEGTIEIAGDTVVSQSPGRLVVNVKSDGDGIRFQLKKINPNNPVRNIRVIMPGFEQTYQKQPFHPLFLKRLAPFGVIRFMDWMSTNNSPVVNWTDRNKPNTLSQAGDKGAALEYMIQLANATKASPWFTIPHQASDDYVRQFATMVRDRLDPALKVHIEYSNEVWNGIFSQSNYAQEKGLALGLSSDRYEAQARFNAQRSVEIFKIFEQVFGGKERLVRVLAWQAVNPGWSEVMLTWKDAYRNANAYAIAPYFNSQGLTDPKNISRTLQMTPDQILDVMQKSIREDRKGLVENVELTKKYGLPLIAYEGGEDLSYGEVPQNLEEQANKLFKQVSRHPRMRELYREYLSQWQEVGGGLFNQYSDITRYAKWGHWGALEYQDQPINTAPKYQGLIEFSDAKSSQSTAPAQN